MNQETQGLSKQQIKSRETRAKIFQAAKRILQKQGYEQLSIKNICEEAGVSNGSFYHHFKTKDDLLSYYIEEQPSMDPDLLELPSSAAETKEAIISVYLNYVHYYIWKRGSTVYPSAERWKCSEAYHCQLLYT